MVSARAPDSSFTASASLARGRTSSAAFSSRLRMPASFARSRSRCACGRRRVVEARTQQRERVRLVELAFQVGAGGRAIDAPCVDEPHGQILAAQQRLRNDNFDPVGQRKVRMPAIVDLLEGVLQPSERTACRRSGRTRCRDGRGGAVPYARERRRRIHGRRSFWPRVPSLRRGEWSSRRVPFRGRTFSPARLRTARSISCAMPARLSSPSSSVGLHRASLQDVLGEVR